MIKQNIQNVAKRVMSAFAVFVGTIALFGLGVVGSVRAEITDKQFEDAMSKYLASDAGKQTLGKTVESYFMERQKEMQKKQQEEQMKQARQEVENSLKNPVKIDAGSSPSKGPASAKVTIIEFSDFQCPYCKKGFENMEEVVKMYPKDVRLVFKNLPLDFHEKALPAAKAAMAANKQGKFWQMHDAFFQNQGKLGDDFFLEQAKTLGLDVEKFKTDMNSEEVMKQINDDKALAAQNQIQGTPGFFVNGVPVKGAYPPEHFKMIIDKLLGKADTADQKKAA